MKKQQVMNILVAGLAVGLVGCGKAKTSQPTVAIYHQAKQGTQIWYEVPNYENISGDSAINSIYVLKNNKLTEYGVNYGTGDDDTRRLKDLKAYSDKEIIQLAKKWNIESMESEYDYVYGNKNVSGYVKPKYGKSEMVKRSLPKPVKVSYELTKNSDNGINKEVMIYSSLGNENATVKYGLIKTGSIKKAAGQNFIGFRTVEEIDGSTKKLKNQFIQRVASKHAVVSYDSVKEPGITVKKTEN
ncbi:hypothetical protein ACE5SX_13615 [Lactiplantibacillus plantarum]|uniref:hypothetical protein n=1 Tax=Lactiplantibacillus TaxID=2767842 RepID=UPI001C1FA04C|nr:hypothetical protein [Lactiplantibacillus sp. 30.2.29]MBU7485129.1 hypothetical protein [Lactiplantibacillus sp. 30.2.29]MCG0659156.1 hypothetical protein [Lactiplantibacillus plantarum]